MTIDVILEVCFKLSSIHEVHQSGPKLWVFYTTSFLLEPEVCIYGNEETKQPPIIGGYRTL